MQGYSWTYVFSWLGFDEDSVPLVGGIIGLRVEFLFGLWDDKGTTLRYKVPFLGKGISIVIDASGIDILFFDIWQGVMTN